MQAPIKHLVGDAPRTVLTDARLRWPDTFSQGLDGTMDVAASRIQDTVGFKPDAPPSITPRLFSFAPVDAG